MNGEDRITQAKKSGGRPRRLFDRQQIIDLRAQGFSYRHIARQLGLGDGTVRRILRAASDAAEVRQNPVPVIL